MDLACLQTPAAGSPLQMGLRFGAARVDTLATGQTASSAWTHSYDRKIYAWLAPGNCAGSSCAQVMTHRVQLENGEAYDFIGVLAATGVTNLSTESHVRGGNLSFDAATQLYSFSYPRGQIDSFNAAGELTRSTARDGSYLEFSRLKSGSNVTQLDIISRPTNRSMRLTYADVGAGAWRLTEVSDPSPPTGTTARLARMSYIAGNLTKYVDPAGRVQQFRYDAQNRMVSIYDAANDPDVLGALAKATTVSYIGSSDTVSQQVSLTGTTLTLTPITGQAWDLAVVEQSGAQNRTLRFTRDSFQRFTRHYLPNSTTQFEETVYDPASGGIAAQYDASRRVTQQCYGTAGNVKKIRRYRTADAALVACTEATAAGADETQFVNNAFGQPEVIVEAGGRVVKYTYAGPGGAVDTIYLWDGVSVGQWTQIAYAPVTFGGGAQALADLPSAVTLPDGTVHRQTYDALGMPLLTTLDSTGLALSTRTRYDARGYLLESTDARGLRTQYEYSQNPANGQFGNAGLASAMVIDADGSAVRSEYQYNALGLLTRQVDDVGGLNSSESVSYVPVGSAGGYAPSSSTDAAGAITQLSYTGFGELQQLIQKAAAAGGVDRSTQLTYTPEGWPDTVILADGRVAIDRSYGLDGLLTGVRDARGATTTYLYDGKGRLQRETIGTTAVEGQAAINGSTRYEYDAADRINVIRRSDNSIAYQASYDGLGRLSVATDGAGHQTRYSYDAARNFLLGQIIGADNASEQIQYSFTYDRLGRRNRQVQDPNGLNLITDYRYTDSASTDRVSLQQVIDAKGGVTRYRYNSLNQLAQVIDALGNSTGYVYDRLARLAQITPASGAASTYAVDALGRVQSLSRGDSTESWAYYPDGLLRTHTDLGGQLISYGYDLSGRMTSIDYAGTSDDPNGARSDASMSYSANDLLLSVTSKPDGISAESTSYAYDAANRLINRTRGGRTVGYGYDADSRMTAMHYWLQMAVDYGYGTAVNNGELRSLGIRDGAGVSTSSSYDYRSSGLLKQITRASSASLNTSFSYDSAGRSVAIAHSRAGVPVQGVNYSLDRLGNRLSQIEQLNAGAGVASFNTSYGYDALSRLISVDATAMASQPRQVENYVYDAAGNRSSIIVNRPTVAATSTGDLNGDGVSDFYFREFASSNTQSLTMGGNLGMTVANVAPATSVASSAWQPTVMADFAGTGKTSVLWRNSQSGENYLAQLGGKDGNRTVATADIDSVPDSAWRPQASADFNQDGVPDILWRNTVSGEMVVWAMGGTDGAQKIAEIWLEHECNADWQVRASGDFNRDGKPDLVWRNRANGENRVWIMGGDNNAARQQTVNLFAVSDLNWDIIGASDQDKDGTVDLLWQNQWGAMSVWYMSPNYLNSEVMREWQTVVNPFGSAGVGPGVGP